MAQLREMVLRIDEAGRVLKGIQVGDNRQLQLSGQLQSWALQTSSTHR
jgi:hypothetical protein